MNSNTAALAGVFATLEESHPREFVNRDWCRHIRYDGGRFSSPMNCDLGAGDSTEEIPPFECNVARDFEMIASALETTGLTVSAVRAQYDSEGRVAGASFDVEHPGLTGWTYQYSPDYGELPEDIPSIQYFTRVNDDWYFIVEDWM